MASPSRPSQQPPTYSLHHPDERQPDPIIPYPRTLFESPEFHSQLALIEKHLAAKIIIGVRNSPLPPHLFETQVVELDDLLDARWKFENLCTLAADDCPPPSKEKPWMTDWRRPPKPVRRWRGELDLEALYYNGSGLNISHQPKKLDDRLEASEEACVTPPGSS